MTNQMYAYLFPGQGSQAVGMGLDLANAFPIARQTFLEADEILDFSLSALAWEGPESDLNDTVNTQPALLVCSVAVLRVMREQFPAMRPTYVAGHSMGQLSALVAAGCLDYANALRLVRRRGELMKMAGETNPGGMAAILGLDIPTMEMVCSQASTADEVVQVANDNCPGQVVISGAAPALERAISLATAAGARRARSLAVSIAAHSPLMASAQALFTQAVQASPITDPSTPLIGNVTASSLSTATQVRAELEAQLNARVRWTESIQFMVAEGVAAFFELGSGSVLAGLGKRIDDRYPPISIATPLDLEKLSGIVA
jgi:[acyl-carrier-protein] S-malonyltransferase